MKQDLLTVLMMTTERSAYLSRAKLLYLYVFQIFPSVGHNLQIIEKYFHKVVRHFITDSFNYEEQNEKDYQKLESGILKDISAWLN